MPFLLSVERKFGPAPDERFPFSVPAIAGTARVNFSSSVTFLVGENGSGKSTFLEALAVGAKAITIGGQDIERDETLAHARLLAASYRFGWRRKTGRGFFMRAEDFFNFGRRMMQTTRELDELISSYQEELKLRPRDAGLQRAIGYIKGQREAIVARYGENLDTNSHGEGFMKVFQARFSSGALYLLDEPEAALSPLRQLSLLAMMKQLTRDDCQFIIATHSPILMAFPDAEILSFDAAPIASVAYEEVEHVKITQSFLRDPEAFLRRM